MVKAPRVSLSRRESQIMDIIYRLGEASVSDVVHQMDDDAGYDSVRVILGILAKKGHLKFRKDGRRHIYRPTVSHDRATRSALRNVLRTFFAGSPSRAILTMLDISADRLTEKELEEIAAFIEEEKRK